MINFFFVSKLRTPKSVTGGTPLSRNTFFTEIFVEVLEPGCYAIELTLKDRELTGPDILIGSQETPDRRCFCFPKPLQRRRFHAYGAAPAPARTRVVEPTAATGDIPNDELTPLSGRWPRDDGRFSSDLELFVEASIYLCRAGTCDGDEGCGIMPDEDLRTPLVTRTGDIKVVDIKGGNPFRPLEFGMEKAMDLGGALVGRLFSDSRPATPPAAGILTAALAERRLERLERRLRQGTRPLSLATGGEIEES